MAPKTKSSLHVRNLHRRGYDFSTLTDCYPELGQYVRPNKYGNLSIDFFDPKSVKSLNTALVKYYYQMDYWDWPEGFLCPPVPGRVDYIHYLADVLASMHGGEPPTGSQITGLDIGCGASLIYPILGRSCYGWQMVASDAHDGALESAHIIIKKNKVLRGMVRLQKQDDVKSIFKGVVKKDDRFDFVMCNPPFYDSPESANKQSYRKYKNLNKGHLKFTRNFSGQPHELWCDGGESAFIKRMIAESVLYSANCLIFSTLVSNEDNLPKIYQKLNQLNATDIQTINMTQGNKKSRFVAWSFKSDRDKQKWVANRWNKNKL